MANDDPGAPTWDEIARLADFVLDRAREQFARAPLRSFAGPSTADGDRYITLINTVCALRAGPVARFRPEWERAHRVEDDSHRRARNFTDLRTLARRYREHPAWDPNWSMPPTAVPPNATSTAR